MLDQHDPMDIFRIFLLQTMIEKSRKERKQNEAKDLEALLRTRKAKGYPRFTRDIWKRLSEAAEQGYPLPLEPQMDIQTGHGNVFGVVGPVRTAYPHVRMNLVDAASVAAFYSYRSVSLIPHKPKKEARIERGPSGVKLVSKDSFYGGSVIYAGDMEARIFTVSKREFERIDAFITPPLKFKGGFLR